MDIVQRAPKKNCQNGSIKRVGRPLGFQGKRFIVVHGWSGKGFVDGADYHGDMNRHLLSG